MVSKIIGIGASRALPKLKNIGVANSSLFAPKGVKLNVSELVYAQGKAHENKPELLQQKQYTLSSLTKVNEVPQEISTKFLAKFDDIMKTFEKSQRSIDELYTTGGIGLSYPREAFKTNILGLIKNLEEKEQAAILNKFGLKKVSSNILGGLPIKQQKTDGLNSIEKTLNNEIGKFLDSKVILPKGFDEYLPAFNAIFKAIPEFKFTIGSKQHQIQKYSLDGHILRALQENTKNPLYQTLNSRDKRILNLSTLMHDINKTESTYDPTHPIVSSQTADAIVHRMKDLTETERTRITNFIKNHHWLTDIKGKDYFNAEKVKEIAAKFKTENDFTLAKIFSNSDLKAVNDDVHKAFSGNIDTPMVKAIEDEILKLQSKG